MNRLDFFTQREPILSASSMAICNRRKWVVRWSAKTRLMSHTNRTRVGLRLEYLKWEEILSLLKNMSFNTPITNPDCRSRDLVGGWEDEFSTGGITHPKLQDCYIYGTAETAVVTSRKFIARTLARKVGFLKFENMNE